MLADLAITRGWLVHVGQGPAMQRYEQAVADLEEARQALGSVGTLERESVGAERQRQENLGWTNMRR